MRARTHHRGISLMEVLISIGIVTVGLLGALALVPVAGNSALQASRETRKGELGRRALDEFTVRGMNDYNSWADADGDPVVTDPYGIGTGSLEAAYCIDPLYLLARPAADQFPEGASGTSMPRVTLREPDPSGNLGSSTTIDQALARQVFWERDNLNIELPDDDTLPPEQVYYPFESDTPQKRAPADRPFSWFATLVRSPQTATSGFAQQDPLVYTLSIAVCYNRIIPQDQTAEPLEQTVSAACLGSGYGGGPFELTGTADQLQAEPGSTSDNTPSLRPGQWVMLMGQLGSSPIYQWYRILDATPYEEGKVAVTLDGADWPVTATGGSASAVIFRGDKTYQGVVAVYEKTIRLESTLLWGS